MSEATISIAVTLSTQAQLQRLLPHYHAFLAEVEAVLTDETLEPAADAAPAARKPALVPEKVDAAEKPEPKKRGRPKKITAEEPTEPKAEEPAAADDGDFDPTGDDDAGDEGFDPTEVDEKPAKPEPKKGAPRKGSEIAAEVNVDFLQKLIRERMESHGLPDVKRIFGLFKAAKFSDVKEKDYAQFAAELQAE